jgi:hypothetical protein
MNANKRESKGYCMIGFVRGLLLLLVAATAWAEPPKPIFPNDSKDPKQSGGAALLEAVCPGRVIVGKEIGCRGACPEFTGFPREDFGWHVAAVTRGHFLSAQSDDAALWMTGCEPHSSNWGGTILLTRHSQKWSMLWYKAGVATAECHNVNLRDRREILLCLGGWGVQAIVETQLYVVDLRTPEPAGMAGGKSIFFSVDDNTGTCGENLDDESKPEPLEYAYVERVEFKGNKAGPSYLSVTAHSGERTMTPQDVAACIDEQNPNKPHKGLSFLPPIKREQIDFLFEGGTYRRSSKDRK